MWRVDTYRDLLTEAVLAIEVVPTDDIAPHRLSDECDCLPKLRIENGIPILTHGAFDGREYAEGSNKSRGN